MDHWATGVATVTTAEGEPHFEIPRPAAFDAVVVTPEIVDKAMRWKPDWLYFGTLLQTEPNIERGTHDLNRALRGVRCFYDMNLRRGHWNVPLVQRLCKLASVLKLNEVEARLLGEMNGIPADTFTLQAFCKATAEKYELDAICITLGAEGCCVYEKDSFHNVPVSPLLSMIPSVPETHFPPHSCTATIVDGRSNERHALQMVSDRLWQAGPEPHRSGQCRNAFN